MFKRISVLLGLLSLLSAVLPAYLTAQISWEPSIGYVFPAGGSRGDSFEVYVGGQRMGSIKSADVTGEGVSVEVVKRYPALRNLNGDQRKVINWRIAQREEALTGKAIPGRVRKQYEGLGEEELKIGNRVPHPLFDRIDTMDTGELNSLRRFISGLYKRQFTAAIAETMVLQVTIAENAELGERELRLLGNGITGPLRFQVSDVQELREKEPNGPGKEAATDSFRLDEAVVWNGQIMPGDVDRFRLNFEAGEQVYFEVLARRLIPYIADAVPGWFQATLSVLDPDGQELAFVDDYRGNPDPILDFTAPRAGEYTVEVRDSIYRGREDFIYRLFVSHERLTANELRQLDVDYDLPELPFMMEAEPNEPNPGQASRALPFNFSGVIAEPGDVDAIAVSGRQGDALVVEVEARKLGSPLDSLVRLITERGEMIAYNDDFMLKRGHVHTGPGLQTHHADSYLETEFPQDGRYFVLVEDAQGRGGADYKYRVRVSQPNPTFEVRCAPSALNFNQTGCAAIHLWVNRKDGFKGPVEVKLAAPQEGVQLYGGLIPAGENSVWAVVRIPKLERHRSMRLELIAEAALNPALGERTVVPTDNRMQAFLWRHLVPTQELRTYERSSYTPLNLNGLASAPTVELARVGTTELRLPIPKPTGKSSYSFRIKDGPDGWELSDTVFEEGELVFNFVAVDGAESAPPQGRFLLEMIIHYPERKDGKKPRPGVGGVLPPILYTLSSDE